ncbi:unnamed protein product [Cunninghamella blakesleeana]
MQCILQLTLIKKINSTSCTTTSKLHNIIKNFYIKAAHIIIQARINTEKGKVNKWFSLITTEMIFLREELRFWFTQAINPTLLSIPPMIIYIYLDTSRFSLDQFFRLLTGSHSKNVKYNFCETHGKKIVLESWLLHFKPPYHYEPSLDLPNLYKRSITFFRSLHSLTRLLSCSQLFNKNAPLGYRLGTEINTYRNDEIPIDQPLLKNDNSKQTEFYRFSKVPTPIGTFQLNVYYRNYSTINDINDIENSDPFDFNESCFLPPLINIQYNHHQQHQLRQHTLYRSQSSPLLQQNKKTMSESKIFVKPSISPFKSPSLASSSIPSYSQNNVPTIEKSKSTTITKKLSLPSTSTSYKTEFYSSFENYKSKDTVSRRNLSQLSIQKPNEKNNSEKENDLEEFMRFVIKKPDLKLFHDQKNIRNDSLMIDSTAWSPYSGTDSGFLGTSKSGLMRSKLSLSHFQSVQNDTSELSESLATTLNSNDSSTHCQQSTSFSISNPSSTSSAMSYSLAVSSSSSFTPRLKQSIKMKSSDMIISAPSSTSSTSSSSHFIPQTSISAPSRPTTIKTLKSYSSSSDIANLLNPIISKKNHHPLSLSSSSLKQKNKKGNNNSNPILNQPIMESLIESEELSKSSPSSSSSLSTSTTFDKYF